MYRLRNEGGDMIVSNPKQDLGPTLPELIKREINQMRERGMISSLDHDRMLILTRVLARPIKNIYDVSHGDLKPVINFLLRQIRK